MRFVTLGRIKFAFHTSVILLHDVVEVSTLADLNGFEFQLPAFVIENRRCGVVTMVAIECDFLRVTVQEDGVSEKTQCRYHDSAIDKNRLCPQRDKGNASGREYKHTFRQRASSFQPDVAFDKTVSSAEVNSKSPND